MFGCVESAESDIAANVYQNNQKSVLQIESVLVEIQLMVAKESDKDFQDYKKMLYSAAILLSVPSELGYQITILSFILLSYPNTTA